MPLRGNFTVSPSALERAGIAGQDYVHGYSELPRVPYIEGDITTVVGMSTEELEAITRCDDHRRAGQRERLRPERGRGADRR